MVAAISGGKKNIFSALLYFEKINPIKIEFYFVVT